MKRPIIIILIAAIVGIGFYIGYRQATLVRISSSGVNDNVQGNPRQVISSTSKEYIDVREGLPDSKRIDQQDLSHKGQIIPTFTFNQKTIWPEPAKMPKDINPQDLLEAAMNPGLGIRELHRSSLTGKGIRVGIIDQPMYLDHPEFAGKIIAYKDFGSKSESSMHGPAVTSLLVGTKIGTAPDARVYYAAVPSWLQDAEYYAKALDWMVEENRRLPGKDKIRVISVSATPSAYTTNTKLWDERVVQAEKEGILILDCSEDHGFISACYYDLKDRENAAKCTPGFPGRIFVRKNRFCAPTSPRTTAEEYTKGDFGYQYTGRGGLSWAIPYCAGVLALGWQERPELNSKEIITILLQSAYSKDSNKIINPVEFIKQVKDYKIKP